MWKSHFQIGHFLYRLFCPKKIFFNICVLFQFLLDWIHFQNIHILHIKNHCSIHFFLVFKTVKSHLLLVLSCVLYDHRRLPFLTFDPESSCSKSEKKIPFFIRGQKSAIMDKKCWLSKISEIGQVITHFIGHYAD